MLTVIFLTYFLEEQMGKYPDKAHKEKIGMFAFKSQKHAKNHQRMRDVNIGLTILWLWLFKTSKS